MRTLSISSQANKNKKHSYYISWCRLRYNHIGQVTFHVLGIACSVQELTPLHLSFPWSLGAFQQQIDPSSFSALADHSLLHHLLDCWPLLQGQNPRAVPRISNFHIWVLILISFYLLSLLNRAWGSCKHHVHKPHTSCAKRKMNF